MTSVHLIFGAGGIGSTERGFVYTWDTPEKVTDLLHIVKEYGISELDSAAGYPPGNPWNAELLLGQSPASKDFRIDTKILARTEDGHPLSATNIEQSMLKSLQLLNRSRVRTLYSHMPDSTTPIQETAAAFHKLYQEGKFECLGLCNYSLQQLTEYLGICEKHGYVKPSIIQDQYNALSRQSEQLFPLMRQHKMSFNAYSPLAGGFLTGKVTLSKDKSHPEYKPLPTRSRWAGESTFAIYPDTFDNSKVHAALTELHDICQRQDPVVSVTEVSLRWLAYHSMLQASDGIILGATKVAQLHNNVTMIKNGPLPEALIAAVNKMHEQAEVGDMFHFAR